MPCCMCEEYEWEDPQRAVYTNPADGKEYCLFHAPAEHKGIPVDDFNSQVLRRVNDFAARPVKSNVNCCLRGVVFPGKVLIPIPHSSYSIDYSNACFMEDISVHAEDHTRSGDITRALCGNDLLFKGAHFNGKVNFERTCFRGSALIDGACFEGDVTFKHSLFEKKAVFNDALFKGKTDFESTEFSAGASFNSAVFSEHASFDSARFEGVSSFMGIKFKGDAEFWLVTFRFGALFTSAEFGGRAGFGFAEFGDQIDFNYSSFRGDTSFGPAKFEGKAAFSSAKFEGDVFIISVQFGAGADFISISTAKDSVLQLVNCNSLLAPILFQECDPTCLDLTQQYDLTNVHFVNASWERNGRIKACTEDEPGKLQPTRDFYQRMKAKYKAENNEYEASKWHIAEKEAQLKLLRQNGESRLLCFALWLYKQVSGFGENPVRASWVLLGVLALPLLVLTGVEVWYHFAWWNFDFAKVDSVFKEWLKFIPLTRAIPTDEPGTSHALMSFWQLLVTLQAALFAFALRNRFRR